MNGSETQKHVILVVDDNADFAAGACAELTRAGYAPVHVTNGKDALSYLASNRPSVILLDLKMPVMGGQEFREAVRHDAVLGKIPMIVLTAGSVPKGLAADVQVLQKPLPAGLLTYVVAQHCQVPPGTNAPPGKPNRAAS